jgi:hypothetical protein
MCDIRLRDIKHPDQKASDGTTLRGRLEVLMVKVAKDIKACGNACDTYTKKNILSMCLGNLVYNMKTDLNPRTIQSKS